MLRSAESRRTRSMRRLASNRSLARSMKSRATIEQAKGILIARLGCTPEQAFHLLVSQSQHENRKVRDLAGELVSRNTKRQGDGEQRGGRTRPRAPANR